MKVSDIQSSSLKDCTSKLQQVAEAQSEFMQIAIQEAREGISNGDGGPFGTAIVRDGVLIASGHNHVLAYNGPTCHGEVDAIRKACKRLGTFDLTGCDIYASCEPCPMCLGAIYWARLSRLFYAATQHDAAAAGFDDAFIYRELSLPPSERHLPTSALSRDEALRAFEAWREQDDKVAY